MVAASFSMAAARLTFKDRECRILRQLPNGRRLPQDGDAFSGLLETGAIQPGVSGPLFWDEPESNLNPKLMKLLVQILLELSRNGQQIILATHDYVLLKWFDLLSDKGKDDHVLYHVLCSGDDGIDLDSAESFQELSKNAIAETFG